MAYPRPHGLKRERDQALKPPEVVRDWTLLDAAIDDYIARGAAAAATHAAYAKRWQMWEAHCQSEGADPWAAPADVFEALWLLRAADGTPLSYNTIEGIASAVKHHYDIRGLTPAHKLPPNAARWRDLRRASIKAQSLRRDTHSAKSQVVPLLRDEALKMIGAKLPWTNEKLVMKAAVLLALDGVTPGRIDKVRTADVQLLDDGGVAIAGHKHPCDHTERAAGVPWDCTACAVRAVLDAAPGNGQLLESPPHGWVNLFPALRSRSRHLTEANQPWGPRDGLTDWELAGLRRGLVLHCCRTGAGTDQLGLRWVRARAMLAAGWSCGLRLGSDTERLDRTALRPDPNGRGWTLTLGVTKDDQAASKAVTRAFPWTDLTAGALAEYACVRDALTSDNGPLFTLLTKKGPAQHVKAATRTAGDTINFLASLAGLEPVYSSYSTRKGYATQAKADHWAPEDIRDGLRHLHLTTTVSHYMPGEDTQHVSQRLVGRLDNQAGAACA